MHRVLSSQAEHRPPAVAGLFYPDDPAELADEVASLLAAADRDGGEPAPKIIVVPHAGYVYSGPIAASAYARLAPWAGRIRRVVLLGPAHRVAVRGLALPTAAAFDTPLGAVALDREAVAAIAGLPQVVRHGGAHAQEHSLEVQLPFLQAVLDDFTLVPLAVGEAGAAEVAEVIERLWGGDETLVVVSTDLSHYLPYRRARETDEATARRIVDGDATIAHGEACGATPLNGALLAARAHRLEARLLDLRNSGDTAGDRARVVGYAAFAFTPAARDADAEAVERTGAEHDAPLGAALLARARNAIAFALDRPLVDEPAHPRLAERGATFVTLRRHGELRGCVGRIEAAAHSLDADVRHHARAAAFDDTRFEPLAAAEWEGLVVEVSLLDAPEPLAVRDEADARARLRPHVDGVVLAWQGRRATFLPQVWEQLPDARDFLAALKRKAGLPADFWHPTLELSRYTVRKFAEPPEPTADR